MPRNSGYVSFSRSRDPVLWPGIPEDSPANRALDQAYEEAEGIDIGRGSGGHRPDTSLPGELLALAYPDLFPVIREYDNQGLIF